MVVCSACDQKLFLESEVDIEDGSAVTSEEIPDDVELICHCHFHWYVLAQANTADFFGKVPY